MIIYIGADHGGFEFKEQLTSFLESKSFEVVDVGNTQLDDQDDYPDFASSVAKEVASNMNHKGILICRTGVGMCIAANKYKGVRAVLALQEEMVKRSREDEDTNVLCLAGDFMSLEEMKTIVMTWLETSFNREERHIRRLKKIESFV